MEDQVVSQTTESSPPVRGAAWRLQGIFFEPSATFEDINLKPGFIVPLILSILVAFLAWFVIDSVIDLDEYLIAQIEKAPQAERLTAEQIEQQAKISGTIVRWVGPAIGPLIMLFLVSGVLMLLIYLSGSETTFMKLLGVASHTFFFQTVVGSILLAVVFSLTQDPQAIDVQNPYMTNLGHLFNPKESPVVYRFMSSMDLISFYVIYLLGLGVSKVSRKISVGKGVVLVFIPFLLYVLGATGIAALTN
ncbi:MAG: YIP1 family protein [Acidobacteriota bacterium]|nr:MAG: YIP1 family protein [Acidobacteriota bacterium]